MITFLFSSFLICLRHLIQLTTIFSSLVSIQTWAYVPLHSHGFSLTFQKELGLFLSTIHPLHLHHVCIEFPKGQCWVLFSLFLTPLLSLTSSLNTVNHQLFTDDTQFQKSTPYDQFNNTTHTLQACTGDVKTWMTASQLKLNDDKTETLLFAHSSHPDSASLPTSIALGSRDILFFDSARNLDFILDSKPSMKNTSPKSVKLSTSNSNVSALFVTIFLRTQPNRLSPHVFFHGQITANFFLWVLFSSNLSKNFKTLQQDSF